MSAFLKSALGIFVLSAAMIAGMGSTNDAEARPYRGYYGGYRGGYNSYYAPRNYSYYGGYRYNAYRPYYGDYYNNYYARPYGYYNNWYGPRNYIGVGPVRIGW